MPPQPHKDLIVDLYSVYCCSLVLNDAPCGNVAQCCRVTYLRSITGKYHTVTCLDVMIHYPQDKADAMIAHLASLADKRLIISFAPKTPYYSILKRIGELFPGPSKVGGARSLWAQGWATAATAAAKMSGAHSRPTWEAPYCLRSRERLVHAQQLRGCYN